MKLEKVLDQLNSFEKNSFLKIINDIVSNSPKNEKEIDAILSADVSRDLKNVDNVYVSKVFQLVEDEFTEHVRNAFVDTTTQLDILIDIIIRDGNCIMKQDWFSRLYESEIKAIKTKVKNLQKDFQEEGSSERGDRRRDYLIYKACLETAYTNDEENNSDKKVTADELSILLTLSKMLDLSQEEIKLINYIILPVENHPVDDVINDLKNNGFAFYSKKQNTIYVADEVVRVLRKVRGKEVADKFFRRILKTLREPEINRICKKHNIDWRNSYEEKINDILNEGISFTGVLTEDLFKEDVKLNERKSFFNDLCEKKLNVMHAIKGATLDDKVKSLIEYFEEIEKDEKVGISIDGFEQLLIDLAASSGQINDQIRKTFQLQPEKVMNSELLLDYNIKPRDILELLSSDQLKSFCDTQEISTRGDEISNILDAYKDSENLYLENYVNFGYRDLNSLKDNGIRIKEAQIGVKFEELTKTIFESLGFNVDEGLRKELNSKKDQMDVLLNLGNNELILIECKTAKDSGFNKFSSVSRQMKSYMKLVENTNYKVIKSLLVAPEFSDDFISDTELETELNLSLITASSLLNILDGFKKSSRKEFPYVLLMRDVLIQEDRIIKAITK